MHLSVRQLGPILHARRPEPGQAVILPWGEQTVPAPDSLLLYQGSQVVRIIKQAEFEKDYVCVDDDTLTVSPAGKQRLERTTGFGTLRSEAELIQAVERLATIEIGGVHIDFTPGQLEEIAHRATKRGRPVEAEIRATIDRIKEELFWRG